MNFMPLYKDNKKRKIVPIQGMHCRSCEILIEEELLKIKGVNKVHVSEKKGIAEIIYTEEIHDAHIAKVINNCGYSIGKEDKRWITRDPKDFEALLKAAVVALAFYFVAKGSGLFNLTFNSSNNLTSLPIVLLVGLTAGFSTCMALIGGLVLGVSARFAEQNPFATSFEKFKPHLFFNLGRVIFFIIFGALIGYFGSLVQLGPTSVGILTIIVGLAMLLLGLQTTAMFPVLNKVKFTFPKGLYKFVGMDAHKQNEYSNKGAFMMGGLTFFLPCGFTQAMQLFAISSGSALTGALTMGVFALGTAPGLLGIGGLTSLIKGAFAKTFFKFVGLMVIGLSIFNITNGLNLAGLAPIFEKEVLASSTVKQLDPNVTIESGIQIVKMTQKYNGYSPRTFTIQNGLPVKWIITSTDANSCAASIASSQLDLRKILKKGENIIEFTPITTGIIRFSCSMGMYTGSFKVIDGPSPSTNTTPYTQSTPKTATVQSKDIAPPVDVANAQVISATYDSYTDIVPNRFTVKVNQPVRFEIDPKEDGYGCMSSVALPGLSDTYEVLQKGRKTISPPLKKVHTK